ncbi:Uncharacterised protein [Mycobacteroides abscessus subsp. abscessus]|nr:Uncharacterised protein [Mycobacteroides abscessus subsp. abscessus]
MARSIREPRLISTPIAMPMTAAKRNPTRLTFAVTQSASSIGLT